MHEGHGLRNSSPELLLKQVLERVQGRSRGPARPDSGTESGGLPRIVRDSPKSCF